MDSTKPKVKKESKNKIKVDFDRTPLKERMKAKFLNFYFLSGVVVKIFRFVFLLGIAYIVLFPFISKISSSFMSPSDFLDQSVRLIPKKFTVDTYKNIFIHNEYMRAFVNTLMTSLTAAFLQTFVCCFIAYGLAKYKFKGNNLVFMLVMLTMIIPHKTIQTMLVQRFHNFDILNILSFLSGGASTGIDGIDNVLASIKVLNLPAGINLLNTFVPIIILSITGLAFKNGLYIFMLRQFFRGIPDSLEESAYIDGSGDFKTFFRIIIPMSVPMMITVFLFAFCWQWTDTFYTGLFFSSDYSAPLILSSMDRFVKVPTSLEIPVQNDPTGLYRNAIVNTCSIMLILPLVVLYIFLQRYLVEGIERSGLTAE